MQDEKEADVAAAPSPPVNERKLMTKIDLHIVPCLGLLYLLAFLDRINIGNAAILGMRDELGIATGTKYNAALMIFFIPYTIFEVPSNILLKKLKPHVWLSLCMFGFGLVTIFQGLVRSWNTLMVTRFFLGLFEAGMLPGCVYLLSMWYKRHEAQKRFTLFCNSTVLAGAFGGLLASAIGKMDGIRGYHGWRWVFILEGLLTCLVAIANFFFIPDFPEDCQWLTETEREFIRDKLAEDAGKAGWNAKLGWREVLDVFRDYKIFVGGFMFFAQMAAGYGLSLTYLHLIRLLKLTGTGYAYFAPTIISTYGYSPIKSQLYSIPPWVCAYGFSMMVAYLSDRLRHRYLFALGCMLISITGYILLMNFHGVAQRGVQYAALFLINCSSFTSVPILLCWFGMNLGGHRRRSVGTGWQIGFGNMGGIVATYSFLERDAPLYRNGYIIGLSFSCFSIAMATLYFVGLWYENRKRDRLLADGLGGLSEEEEEQLGDLAYTYRYGY